MRLKKVFLTSLLPCFAFLIMAQNTLLFVPDSLSNAQDTLQIFIPKQDTILLEDTLFIDKRDGLYYGEGSQLSVDDLLLYMVSQQSQDLAQREEDNYQHLLEIDTTTAFPFHIGLADSIRIKEYVENNWQSNPLLLPLLYVPLQDTTPLMERRIEHTPSINYKDTPSDTWATYQLRMSINSAVRKYISTYYPDLYAGIYQPDLLEDLKTSQIEIPVLNIHTHKALIKDAEEDRLDNLRDLRKISKWYKEATTMLQLTQNYVSPNWYAGGNTNFAMLGIVQGKIIYNDRKNIKWKNTLEWRMGFNTVQGDTLRKVNTNEDIFRLYSEFNHKIIEKLNATASAEFETQFFNTWNSNEKTLKTGPFTPARISISVGVSYVPIKRLTLQFSPLTYRMVGVADTIHVAQTTFGVHSGKKVLNEAGSSIRVEWTYKPVREIALDTKLYFYTNYKQVLIDLEISADFIINRFLSARIMLHPRYDNTVIVEEGEKIKMQFKELISIGFSHKFY